MAYKRIRARLDSKGDTVKEMAKLYRQARNNQLTPADCLAMIQALEIIGTNLTRQNP